MVISAKRVGSTIIQNVAHIVLTGEKGLVPKVHDFRNTNDKVIIPIRDPRDTAISFYRTIISNQKQIELISNVDIFKNFEIINNLNLMVNLYNFYKNKSNALIIRYEDIHINELGNYSKLVELLCTFFNIPITNELINKVNHYLDINNMKRVSDELASFTKNDSNLDSSFYIHGNHIENKNVVTWESRVDINIVDELNQMYKYHITNLNYNI